MASPRTLAAEIERRLDAVGRRHRAGSVDGHSPSTLRVLGATVPDVRAIVESVTRQIAEESGALVVGLASKLAHCGTLEGRQVAYEILGRRRDARARLTTRDVERLGRANDNWKSVDTFACEVTGPCWREGRLADTTMHRWARSSDRWWRRTALVSTVPLNKKSRGGAGDTPRTLGVCALCADDRDDMVVKACSWALRELVARDAAAVRAFVEERRSVLAPRITREVRNKLASGRKSSG